MAKRKRNFIKTICNIFLNIIKIYLKQNDLEKEMLNEKKKQQEK